MKLKQSKSLDPSCLVPEVKAGGDDIMVYTTEHCWNDQLVEYSAYLIIVADHVHSFMTTAYPSSTHLYQMAASLAGHQITKFKSSHGVFEHDTEFTVLKPNKMVGEYITELLAWQTRQFNMKL